MATAQINARIDANVKALGDFALSSIGYTPTKAVRSLWEFASRNARNPKVLLELFEGIEQRSNAKEAEIAEWEKRVAEGPLIIERALHEMGVENPRMLDITDKELLEEALVERESERGLWHD